jgi:hypothetical protein
VALFLLASSLVLIVAMWAALFAARRLERGMRSTGADDDA